MSKMGKFKRFIIEPNKSHWNKPVEYYKEYVNYVTVFNNVSKEEMQKEGTGTSQEATNEGKED